MAAAEPGPGTRVPRARGRSVWWLVAVVGGLVAVAAVVILVEVQWAKNAPNLANEDGFPQDGLVGGGPAGPTSAASAAAPLHVVWLGDSTAAGVGASSATEALPRQVAAGLERPVQLTVFAVSGARLSDVIDNQLPKLLALPAEQTPDIVLVSVGANDVTHLTSTNTFRSQYLGLLDRLPKGSSAILLGVPDMGSSPRFAQPLRWLVGWRANTLDAVVENMREQGADYVNIADFTGPAFSADPQRYFAADEYHPNDEGYVLWTKTVLPVVKWRLFKREHPNEPEPLQPKEAKGTVKGSA